MAIQANIAAEQQAAKLRLQREAAEVRQRQNEKLTLMPAAEQGANVELSDAAITAGESQSTIELPNAVAEANIPTPIEAGQAGQGSELSRVEAEVRKEGTRDPLVQALQGMQTYDEEGLTTRATSADIEEAISAELAMEADIRNRRDLDYGYLDEEGLMSQLQSPSANSDDFGKIVTLGQMIGNQARDVFAPVMNGTDAESISFRQMLSDNNLLDEAGQLSPRYQNIAAFGLIEVLQNEMVKKDQLLMNDQNPDLSFETSDDINFADSFDIDFDDPVSTPEQGTKLDPNMSRSNLANAILDKASPNPNQVAGLTTGFGGASANASSINKGFLDYLTYQVLQDLGMLTEVKGPNGKVWLELTKDAADYYNSTRGVMDDIYGIKSGLPSLVPTIEGSFLGQEREQGFKRQGNISVASKVSDNIDQELKAMNHMGQIAHIVDPTTGHIAGMAINSVINYTIDKNGKPRIARIPFTDMPERDKLYSTHPLAEMLGLTKQVWDRHYQNAIKTQNMSDFDASEQANSIMAMKARQRINNVLFANKYAKRPFYQRRFFASANMRFHYRSYVLDPQNSKLVRNFLNEAEATYLDVNTTNSEAMRMWKYLIGRELLTNNDLGTFNLPDGTPKQLTVENMGFNATLKLANEKVFGTNYKRLVALGETYRSLLNTGSREVFDARIRELAASGLLKEMGLTDHDGWGFKTDALIDLANYNDALQNKDIRALEKYGDVIVRKPPEIINSMPVNENGEAMSPRGIQLQHMLEGAIADGDQEQAQLIQADLAKEMGSTVVEGPIVKINRSTVFRARVRGKFDGIQSGLSIFGSLFGFSDIMSRTGIMYGDEMNTLPEGDLRDLFLNKLMPAVEVSFHGNSEMAGLFKELLLGTINNSEKSKAMGKAIARAPMMETSYGKYLEFHQDTAMAFIDGEFGEGFRDLIETGALSRRDAINGLTKIIANALAQSLKLEQQALMKDYGQMWAVIGETARVRTITGEYIYMGSRERYGTGETKSFPTSRGPVEIEKFTTGPTGTNRTRKIPKVFDQSSLKFVRGELSPFGQEVVNQYPVLFIQGIDGGLIALTYNTVNEGLERPLFAMDIHDSYITTVRSTKAYIETYNKLYGKFLTPGKNQYKPVQAMHESLLEGIKEMNANLDLELQGSQDTVLVSQESRRWRGMHSFLMKLSDKINEKDEDIITGQGRATTGITKMSKSRLKVMWHKNGMQKYANAEGVYMNAADIKKVIKFVYEYLNLKQRTVVENKAIADRTNMIATEFTKNPKGMN